MLEGFLSNSIYIAVQEDGLMNPKVVNLLWIADWMVHYSWREGKNSDCFSIPYIRELVDLLGSALLALGFLWFIRDSEDDAGD
ncbi:hypothetical protein HPG69_003880 [Diceros bicornis minor]|uniref:Solute carrier family 41 member n=1 Tax=Diceros bicornis minor TaxID=77932 RepID=A0A7J7ETW4_DICBM|nr:hypothetical protein HPG69_003880 [Diceros bicornis minor]